MKRQTSLVRSIDKKTAPVNTKGEHGRTQLHQAILNYVEEDRRCPSIIIPGLGEVNSKNLKKVEELLQNPLIDVNIQDDNGDTPLHLAVIYSETICDLLLADPDINVNIQNQIGNTPLHEAFFKSFKPVRMPEGILKKTNPNIQGKYGNTVLHLAALTGDLESAEIILNNPETGVNMLNASGRSALLLSLSDHGSEKGMKMFQLLLQQSKINVNFQYAKGGTVLHSVCSSANKQAVEKLFKREDIDVNIQDKDGNTPLHYVLRNLPSGGPVHIQILVLLLQHPKINVNSRNRAGNTPLHFAILFFKWNRLTRDTIALTHLLQCPAINVNLQDNQGQSPLHVALRSKHAEARGLFLARSDINLDITDIRGITPRHLIEPQRPRERVANLQNDEGCVIS